LTRLRPGRILRPCGPGGVRGRAAASLAPGPRHGYDPASRACPFVRPFVRLLIIPALVFARLSASRTA